MLCIHSVVLALSLIDWKLELAISVDLVAVVVCHDHVQMLLRKF